MRTWQSLELFDDLTVEENCRATAETPSLGAAAADVLRPRRARDLAAVTWALDLLDCGDLARRHPSDLPLGQRKLVGVARALAARPKLVLLDEPAAGLDTGESGALGERLVQVAGAGITVLLVDHDMGLVLGVCQTVHVLDFGRVVAQGTPEEVRADPRVVEAYLGAPAGADRGRR